MQLHKLKNILLKIDENISSKEEFNVEFETFQLMNYFNNKRIHTTTRLIPSIVFYAVKFEKII